MKPIAVATWKFGQIAVKAAGPILAKGGGVIPHIVNKTAWEKFSRERWLAIGRQYNVTQVLARSDYILDLPVAAENASLRLYRIPE